MKCNVARDLLSLYFDGLCSDETRKQLEEHIENCENCKQLKQNLESELDWSGENQEWEKAIKPLKKVKKKMQRKNVWIGLCILFMLIFAVGTAVLTYGQIAKKGISFELIYDAARFRYIGKQFASGNIEPLYESISNGYLLKDEEAGVLHLAYTDNASYDEDMKSAIMEKYHRYFDGRDLTYEGIEEICYLETPATEWNKTLYISLKFEGENQFVYYIAFYKMLDGQYIVDDYFGNPYLSYSGEGKNAETSTENIEQYHTEDTLFSCLPNRLKNSDLPIMRMIILASGQRALQGDTTLAENGQMRLSILSKQDLADGTVYLQEKVNEKLDGLTEYGYYVTDITCNAKEYDITNYLYKYQVNMELTNETSLEKIIVTLDCYRVSDRFVYIPGTYKIYGNDLPAEVMQAFETLYE